MDSESKQKPKKTHSEPDNINDPYKFDRMEQFYVEKYENLLQEEKKEYTQQSQLENLLKQMGMEEDLLKEVMKESQKLSKQI